MPMHPVPAFAVICHATIYCPDTDAIMGNGSFVYERFLTRAMAEATVKRLNEDAEDERYSVEMRPYKDNEGTLKRPLYTALELYNDRLAFERDFGAPEWAL